MFKKSTINLFISKFNIFNIKEKIRSFEIREKNLDKAYADIDKAYADIKKYKESLEFMPSEFTREEKKIINYVIKNNLSMTQNISLYNTVKYCKYIIDNKIDGDFVECGVWRGGHAILAAKIFELYGARKNVYLYDTFEGMTAPNKIDQRLIDKLNAKTLLSKDKDAYCYADLDEVKLNFTKVNLLKKNVIFVKGDVAKTLKIKNNLPKKIGYLRLDTDWYESSKVELENLYPRLSKKGVLVFDDYGYWKGQKKATDDFFQKNKITPLLHYLSSGARAFIKD
jgi:hypothetical protein